MRRRATIIGLATLATLACSGVVASSAGAAGTCPDLPPTADYSYSPTSPQAGQEITFDARSSFPGMTGFEGGDPITPSCSYFPGAISNYHWNFGDGTSQDTSSPTIGHTFAAAGDYTVSLTVNANTGTNSTSKTVTVSPAPQPIDQTPPPPPPPASRSLTLAYSAKQDAFKGKLSSNAAACVANQRVKVFRQKPGKDPSVGSDMTSPKGKYTVEEPNAEGRFNAKVKPTTAPDGTSCEGAASPPIHVG